MSEPTPCDTEAIPESPDRRHESGHGVATAVVAGLAMALIAILLPAVWPGSETALSASPVGMSAPDFSLRTLDNSAVTRLSQHRGRPVVLNFWASWCAPCQEEAAALAAGERRWRDRGVVFIGVNAQDTATAARAYVRSNTIEYDNLVDTRGDVVREFGVTGFPETFFISAQGVIRAKEMVALDAAALDRAIADIAGS